MPTSAATIPAKIISSHALTKKSGPAEKSRKKSLTACTSLIPGDCVPARLPGPSAGGVPGNPLRGDPDHDTHHLGRQREELLAGTGSVVLLRELHGQLPPDVVSHGGQAAYLGVPLRVVPVPDAQAHAGIAPHVAVLPPARGGGDQHVVSVPADPHDGRLRAPVAIDRAEDRVVGLVEEPAHGVVQ